ncbi:MAG: hypothetical protein R3Y21_01210 [Mycoplasmatota bacterium]
MNDPIKLSKAKIELEECVSSVAENIKIPYEDFPIDSEYNYIMGIFLSLKKLINEGYDENLSSTSVSKYTKRELLEIIMYSLLSYSKAYAINKDSDESELSKPLFPLVLFSSSLTSCVYEFSYSTKEQTKCVLDKAIAIYSQIVGSVHFNNLRIVNDPESIILEKMMASITLDTATEEQIEEAKETYKLKQKKYIDAERKIAQVIKLKG